MKILITPGTGEIEVKKSKFIAHLRSVKTEEEALSFFAETKKKYWDAKHNCTAFVIGEDGRCARCSDDGEPAQTAGRPMLDVLMHSGVRNVACVVTRYFGGVLLGTGGLVKAYSDAVLEALKNSVIGEETEGVSIPFTVDYTNYGKIQYLLENLGYTIEDAAFEADVRAFVKVPLPEEESIRTKLTECTNGQIELGEGCQCSILTVPER